MDIVERLKEFLDNEARSCSMDFGCVTPLYVYRMLGGQISLEEIETKSKVNTETKVLTEPAELGTVFTQGEYKAIQVLREQVICNPPVVKPVAVGKVGENKD